MKTLLLAGGALLLLMGLKKRQEAPAEQTGPSEADDIYTYEDEFFGEEEEAPVARQVRPELLNVQQAGQFSKSSAKAIYSGTAVVQQADASTGTTSGEDLQSQATSTGGFTPSMRGRSRAKLV